MNHILYGAFQRCAARYSLEGPYLEIGASPGGKSILAGKYFKDRPDRHAINLNDFAQEGGITFHRMNSNDMSATFRDGQFGAVLSNAVLEHDKRFWLSLAEMKRVLAPGGIMVVAAPGFIRLKHTKATIIGPNGESNATITHEVHARPDYWRFSRQAFSEVVCEGLDILAMRVIDAIPRIMAVARKPL
jgi:SAM-dependent methyltransferase